MTIDEAQEILELHKHQKQAIAKDLKFNPLHEARYEFGKAKGYLDGWNAAVKKCAEAASTKFTCVDPAHDERWCATCYAGENRAEYIEQEILNLSTENGK